MIKYIAHGHIAKGDYSFLSSGDYASNAVNHLKIKDTDLNFKQRFEVGLSMADQNAKLDGYINKNITTFQQYINLSVREVYIRERSNMLHCLDPVFAPSNQDKVVIRTYYVIDGLHELTYNSICKYMDSVKNLPETVDKEIREVYAEFLSNKQPPNLRKSPVYILAYDVDVPIPVLETGPAYIINKDVVLTIHQSLPDHPFTINGGYDNIISKVERELSLGSSPPLFIAEIVDNSDTISSRFTYCLNQIVEIPVIKNSNKEDGLYINIRKNGVYQQIIEPLDKLETFGLYKTKEEAYAGGDLSNKLNHELLVARNELEQLKLKNMTAKEELDKKTRELDFEFKQNVMKLEIDHRRAVDAIKMDLADKEKENQNLKLVIEKQKLDFEQERLEFEKEKARLESEKIRLKDQYDTIERTRADYYDSIKKSRDDSYDTRKTQRNDSSDQIKFAITLVSGVISAFLLFSKL